MHQARTDNVIYVRSSDLEGLEAGVFEGFSGTRAYYARREFLFGFGEGNGTRQIFYRGREHRLAAAELAIVQAGEPFSAEVQKPLTLKWVAVDVGLFRKTAGLEEGRVARLPYFSGLSINDAQLLKSVTRLHKAVFERAPRPERQKLLDEMVTRAVSKHAGPRIHARRGTRTVQMAQVRDYMQDSLNRPVPLKELAKMVDMSVFQFVRTFAKEIGLTPHALLIHMRVQKARELLRRGVSATAASQEAGFADPSHLVRHFKRVFKVTPGAYASSTSEAEDASGRRGP